MRKSAFWPCIALALVLFGAKAVSWSLPTLTLARVTEYATDLSVSSHNDILFALGLFGLAEAVLFATRNRTRWHQAAWWAFLSLGFASVVYAVASVQIFAFLRAPLTYRLVYLAGDMKSMRSSLGSFVSPLLAIAIVGLPLLWLATLALTRRLPGPPRTWPMRALLLVAIVAHVGWWRHVSDGKWSDRSDHLIVESPHWALLTSYAAELIGGHTPSLDEGLLPGDVEDFAPPHRTTSSFQPALRPRNVVLIVLETTGAKYLSLYGSKYPTTPNLEREAAHALVFDNVYAHVGLTANSMAAMTLSLYPYMTWREYTVEYPAFPGIALAELFRAGGHRTAFLHSGDLTYVNQVGFLQSRGFADIRDVRDLSPDHQVNSWGAEDRIVVDGALRWLDQAPGQPFYLQIWTSQSHHPYEPSPGVPLIDFFKGDLPPDDYDLGRYLNTLHQVDEQLGRLFAGLRARGLADDTLVVITGDHGEGFGFPHRTWGHGSKLYEEGVHVPLILWNPRLFPGAGHVATIGGHVDLNPTVADVMGLEPAPSWRGRSLFDPARPPRTYFYACNDDYLLGLREEGWKYIYNVTTGREELFDLAHDPDEQHSLAGDPQKTRRWRQRLAAWREASARHLAQALDPGKTRAAASR